MQHPYLYYVYVVSHRLKKTVDEIESMDAEQFHNWIAYFHLENPEYKEKIQDEIDRENMTTADFIMKHYFKSRNGKSSK